MFIAYINTIFMEYVIKTKSSTSGVASRIFGGLVFGTDHKGILSIPPQRPDARSAVVRLYEIFTNKWRFRRA